MARTFSMAYDEKTLEGFSKRMYAMLEAQSLAISAALALAATNDPHPQALAHAQLRISQTQPKIHNNIDQTMISAHLGDIFTDARKQLEIQFEWDK